MEGLNPSINFQKYIYSNWLAPVIFSAICLHLGAGFAAEKLPAGGPGVFFVATNGNDQWSGRAAEPNKAKTDGPVRTIDRVLGLTRAAPTNSQGQKLRTVYLRAGTYFLEQPVAIQAEDEQFKPDSISG